MKIDRVRVVNSKFFIKKKVLRTSRGPACPRCNIFIVAGKVIAFGFFIFICIFFFLVVCIAIKIPKERVKNRPTSES